MGALEERTGFPAGSWVEISRSALLHNVRQFENMVGPNTRVLPIIKSNAYGHGIDAVASVLSSRIKEFGVVSIAEALYVRRQYPQHRIIVITYAEPEYIADAIRQHIELPIISLEHIAKINRIAKRVGKRVRVHLKIDTGASRVGILPVDVERGIAAIRGSSHLVLVGIFSHFAASEENSRYTALQVQRFDHVRLKLKDIKCEWHIACTAAIVTQPQQRLDFVRLGIGLYGYWPSRALQKTAAKKSYILRPVLAWKTKIIQIKKVPARTPVGYGLTYITKRRTTIVIVPVGYWDGYDRKHSNNAQVLIGGRRCPVIGRVCMNIMMIDATAVTGLRTDQEVVLIGKQRKETISADELAVSANTIVYEILTRINPLLPRKVVA